MCDAQVSAGLHMYEGRIRGSGLFRSGLWHSKSQLHGKFLRRRQWQWELSRSLDTGDCDSCGTLLAHPARGVPHLVRNRCPETRKFGGTAFVPAISRSGVGDPDMGGADAGGGDGARSCSCTDPAKLQHPCCRNRTVVVHSVLGGIPHCAWLHFQRALSLPWLFAEGSLLEHAGHECGDREPTCYSGWPGNTSHFECTARYAIASVQERKRSCYGLANRLGGMWPLE